jgi:prepilin-type N-terminal cleavage/methylation domain-containing protein
MPEDILYKHGSRKGGFTLLELSIALVIIGLLVGGVLGGKHLIRAARLQTVVSDYQKYANAMNAFKDQYDEYPGDFSRAADVWGLAGGADGWATACYNTDSTGLRTTCNGNGNGRLGVGDNVTDGSAPEWYRSWQHLANAGLVKGEFSGRNAGSPRFAELGVNVPEGSIAGSGFTAMSLSITVDGDWWAGEYDGFMFGAQSLSGYETNQVIINPAEAYAIDVKLDDGKPAYGLVVVPRSRTSCHSSQTASASAYVLSTEDATCSLFFRIPRFGD